MTLKVSFTFLKLSFLSRLLKREQILKFVRKLIEESPFFNIFLSVSLFCIDWIIAFKGLKSFSLPIL